MTEYKITSKGTLNGKPLEVSTQVKATSLLVAIQAFIAENTKRSISLNQLSITDGKS